ncbi:MAG: hypothetical protein RLO21_04980, partial [Nitratireductor sp.]
RSHRALADTGDARPDKGRLTGLAVSCNLVKATQGRSAPDRRCHLSREESPALTLQALRELPARFAEAIHQNK